MKKLLGLLFLFFAPSVWASTLIYQPISGGGTGSFSTVTVTSITVTGANGARVAYGIQAATLSVSGTSSLATVTASSMSITNGGNLDVGGNVWAANISSWTAYSPSPTDDPLCSSGTCQGYWRRVGNNMEVQWDVVISTKGGSNSTITLPNSQKSNGYVLGGFSATAGRMVGDCNYLANGAEYPMKVWSQVASNGTAVYLKTVNASATYATTANFSATVPVTQDTTAKEIHCIFSLPIVGW